MFLSSIKLRKIEEAFVLIYENRTPCYIGRDALIDPDDLILTACHLSVSLL